MKNVSQRRTDPRPPYDSNHTQVWISYLPSLDSPPNTPGSSSHPNPYFHPDRFLAKEEEETLDFWDKVVARHGRFIYRPFSLRRSSSFSLRKCIRARLAFVAASAPVPPNPFISQGTEEEEEENGTPPPPLPPSERRRRLGTGRTGRGPRYLEVHKSKQKQPYKKEEEGRKEGRHPLPLLSQLL